MSCINKFNPDNLFAEKSEENQAHQYQFQQNDKRIIFNKKINTFLSSHRCKVISLIFAVINLLTIFINIMYYLNNKHFTLVILFIIIICVESLCDLILRLISIIKTKLIKSYALYANVVNIIMSVAIIITKSLNIISKQIFIGVTFVICALAIVKNMMCFIRLCSEDHKRRENQKKIVQIIRFDSEIPDNNNNNNK